MYRHTGESYRHTGEAQQFNEAISPAEVCEHQFKFKELETPHSKEVFLAKDTRDPHIYFHEYEDFPPDFYKAEFYHEQYAKIME